MAQPDLYARSIFINCPFSPEYQPIFRALLFTVLACSYRPRCALEISDSSENRLNKIVEIVAQCMFAIHDISFMAIDPATKLPRLNMSFELGLFVAAKSFGAGRHKQKVALILDQGGYRYRDALSDISGHDISVHDDDPKKAIRHVRNWLDTWQTGPASLPGGEYISDQYEKFCEHLPIASATLKLKADQLTYADTCRAIEAWLKNNA